MLRPVDRVRVERLRVAREREDELRDVRLPPPKNPPPRPELPFAAASGAKVARTTSQTVKTGTDTGTSEFNPVLTGSSETNAADQEVKQDADKEVTMPGSRGVPSGNGTGTHTNPTWPEEVGRAIDEAGLKDLKTMTEKPKGGDK